MSDILGSWLICKRQHFALGKAACYQWPDPGIEQLFVPEKRVKTASVFDRPEPLRDCVADCMSEESTKVSAGASYTPTKAEDVKLLFSHLFSKDQLDMKAYRQLAPEKQEVVLMIFKKRYKQPLIDQIKHANNSVASISTFEHLKLKRMDHCEKTIMSMILNTVRDRFKQEYYGSTRPKDLHDEINKVLFSKYFDYWVISETLVEIAKQTGTDGNSDGSELLPRRSAIFCMKKGLTKYWFKAVSTKFIDNLLTVDLETVQTYCQARYSLKLDEIFGTQTEYKDNYFSELGFRIESPKFKLPFTFKELELCYLKAKKKILKLRKLTEESELEEFKAQFGELGYKEAYSKWIKKEYPDGQDISSLHIDK